jgi:CHAT domain-containing protein
MAADTISAGIEGEYLEIADVLGANLERCRLVVLSGCASGVSRPFAGPAGPSLAGAFLDAGARAAIRTAWPVRDDHAASLMGEFIRLWKVDGIPAARALNEAKRRQMLGRHGYRHPVSWAAYAMDLGQASGAD